MALQKRQVCSTVMVTTVKKTAVFCQNRGEPKPRFFWSHATGINQGNFW